MASPNPRKAAWRSTRSFDPPESTNNPPISKFKRAKTRPMMRPDGTIIHAPIERMSQSLEETSPNPNVGKTSEEGMLDKEVEGLTGMFTATKVIAWAASKKVDRVVRIAVEKNAIDGAALWKMCECNDVPVFYGRGDEAIKDKLLKVARMFLASCVEFKRALPILCGLDQAAFGARVHRKSFKQLCQVSGANPIQPVKSDLVWELLAGTRESIPLKEFMRIIEHPRRRSKDDMGVEDDAIIHVHKLNLFVDTLKSDETPQDNNLDSLDVTDSPHPDVVSRVATERKAEARLMSLENKSEECIQCLDTTDVAKDDATELSCVTLPRTTRSSQPTTSPIIYSTQPVPGVVLAPDVKQDFVAHLKSAITELEALDGKARVITVKGPVAAQFNDDAFVRRLKMRVRDVAARVRSSLLDDSVWNLPARKARSSVPCNIQYPKPNPIILKAPKGIVTPGSISMCHLSRLARKSQTEDNTSRPSVRQDTIAHVPETRSSVSSQVSSSPKSSNLFSARSTRWSSLEPFERVSEGNPHRSRFVAVA